MSYKSGFIEKYKNSYFEIFDNGIISIPKFNIFLSIFESNSIHLVNSKGLHQLIDLDPFSLEIDYETKSLRVYLFSKSKKNQLKRIEQSIPLLEAIFPDLLIMTPLKSKELLASYSIAEIAGFSLIQEKESYITPVYNLSVSNQFGDNNKLILAYNSSRKESNSLKNDQTTQVYSLPRYNGLVDFNLIGNIILRKNENSTFEYYNKNKLLRGIIRFQISDFNLISFEEGISYIQKIIASFRVASHSIASEIVPKEDSIPIDIEIESELPMIFKDQEAINPICRELCNIYNNFEISEKNRLSLCEKSVLFCRKLVSNNNFISILLELAKKDDNKRKVQILNELLVHLSFHQLYCLIAQFIFIYEGNDLNIISIQLLHSLINKKCESELHQSRAEQEIQKSIQNDPTVDCETNMTV
ncbi:MAG: hypothetical protein ACTSRJ_06275 [Candidatus Hodarchaeales archaeon]